MSALPFSTVTMSTERRVQLVRRYPAFARGIENGVRAANRYRAWKQQTGKAGTVEQETALALLIKRNADDRNRLYQCQAELAAACEKLVRSGRMRWEDVPPDLRVPTAPNVPYAPRPEFQSSVAEGLGVAPLVVLGVAFASLVLGVLAAAYFTSADALDSGVLARTQLVTVVNSAADKIAAGTANPQEIALVEKTIEADAQARAAADAAGSPIEKAIGGVLKNAGNAATLAGVVVLGLMFGPQLIGRARGNWRL